jgi:23S rRNA (cytosine1962-C5)-methyltransferase
MDRLRQPVVDALVDRLQPRGIFERSEGEGRKKERLEPSTGLLAGQEPPELVAIEEEGLEAPVTLLVDVRKGHKTGTYLDQRISRRRVSRYAPGKAVLNAFSYTGGFGLHAARAGAASVLDIDSSEEALATARASAEKNGVDGVVEHRHGDAFGVLRELRADGRTFDLVILDPPKFVESAAHLRAGSRGYQDINRVAMQLVRPGGHLATFSCSGLVSAEAFQRILWTASREAGRGAQIVERLGQPDDHPVRLDFPEGEYLKGVILRLE